MSGTTPTPGSEPGNERDPFAQPSGNVPAPPPVNPPPVGPPAWSGPVGDPSLSQERPEPPKPVRTAVRLMYTGAALSALGAILFLVASDDVRDELREGFEDAEMSASEIDSAVDVTYGGIIAIIVILVALWLWMAWANGKGRGWARVLSSVLGGLGILNSLLSLGSGGLTAAFGALGIALIVGILLLLWRRESSEYYAAVSRMNR